MLLLYNRIYVIKLEFKILKFFGFIVCVRDLFRCSEHGLVKVEVPKPKKNSILSRTGLRNFLQLYLVLSRVSQRVFQCRLFQCLIFARYAETYLMINNSLSALSTNVRLGRKPLQVTNALAYSKTFLQLRPDSFIFVLGNKIFFGEKK